jgi:hypothetical protein
VQFLSSGFKCAYDDQFTLPRLSRSRRWGRVEPKRGEGQSGMTIVRFISGEKRLPACPELRRGGRYPGSCIVLGNPKRKRGLHSSLTLRVTIAIAKTYDNPCKIRSRVRPPPLRGGGGIAVQPNPSRHRSPQITSTNGCESVELSVERFAPNISSVLRSRRLCDSAV